MTNIASMYEKKSLERDLLLMEVASKFERCARISSERQNESICVDILLEQINS